MHENKNWQRLQAVINWAEMSTNHFACHIGLSRSENLYQIKRGNNGISLNLAQRIVEHFPQVSKLWLLTGDGEMLLEEPQNGVWVPFYRLDAERSIRHLAEHEAECRLLLPDATHCDVAMFYMGDAMGDRLPSGTIVFLTQVLPSHLIPGKEYLVCGKQFDALRVVRSSRGGKLRMVAGDRKKYDDVELLREEIEALYLVCAKMIMN